MDSPFVMHLIINALSVTNSSGRHVLLGHLRELAATLNETHRFTVLHHPENAQMRESLGTHVQWHLCPAGTDHWLKRSLWERTSFPRLVRELKGDAIFTPAGISYAGINVPQIVFCQNPWCMVRDVHRRLPEYGKAFLQRSAYRKAVRRAEVMVFNSSFMRDAYTQNAGAEPKQSVIAYQGIDEGTFNRAEAIRNDVQENPHQILTVSVMGAHKGLETLCEALRLLKGRGIAFNWKIIGAWPDGVYKESILRKIQEGDLADLVEIEGHVSLETLHHAYAESRVFCLMSRCESFGIPAVEAQVFGTPVVTSLGCAMPEIDGEGGLYPPRGDAEATANALERILTDEALRQKLHQRALSNSARFHWRDCSAPLVNCVRSLCSL